MKVETQLWARFRGKNLSRGVRVASYYAAVFGLTHALVAAYLLTGGSWRRLDSFMFANVVMLVPGLTAACVVRWVFREPVAQTLGLSWRINRWLLVAWLLPLVLSGATLLVGLALPGTAYSASLEGLSTRFQLSPNQLRSFVHPIGSLPPIWTLVVQALVLGPTLSTLTGLGEEAGWRGLLHHELASLGFWRESWLIGLLWGAWHIPLVCEGYGYPNHPIAGAAVLLVFTLLASPVYVFLRIRSGSTLAPAVFHGCFGASMLLSFAAISGGNELTVGLLALPGLLVMAAANLLLLWLRPRRVADTHLV